MALSRFKEAFRRLFSIPSRRFTIAPRLPPELGSDENLTRFIFSKSHYAREKGRVRPQALEPLFNAGKDRWETSSFRIQGLSQAEIWQLGYSHVENARREGKIRARGTGQRSIVTAPGLSLDVNGPPSPRHVDIIGWAPGDKHLRLMQATEIADKMQLDMDPRFQPAPK